MRSPLGYQKVSIPGYNVQHNPGYTIQPIPEYSVQLFLERFFLIFLFFHGARHYQLVTICHIVYN